MQQSVIRMQNDLKFTAEHALVSVVLPPSVSPNWIVLTSTVGIYLL